MGVPGLIRAMHSPFIHARWPSSCVHIMVQGQLSVWRGLARHPSFNRF